MADGKRVVHMRKALQYALDSSFKLTSDEILAHFQEIVADQTKRQALVTIANEVLGKVRSNVEDEFQVITQEGNICEKLNDLDALLAEYPELRDGIRVPLKAKPAPTVMMRQQAISRKAKEKRSLTEQLHKLEQENVELRAKVTARRQQVRQISGRCSEQCEVLEKSAAAALELPSSKPSHA